MFPVSVLSSRPFQVALTKGICEPLSLLLDLSCLGSLARLLWTRLLFRTDFLLWNFCQSFNKQLWKRRDCEKCFLILFRQSWVSRTNDKRSLHSSNMRSCCLYNILTKSTNLQVQHSEQHQWLSYWKLTRMCRHFKVLCNLETISSLQEK